MIIPDEKSQYVAYVAVVAAMNRMQMALEAIAICSAIDDQERVEAIALKALESPGVDR